MDWRRLMLGLIALLAIGSGYLVFNNTAKWPFEFKRGLDIQGGMHLVLQAQPTDKIKEITPNVMSAAIAVVRNRVDGLGVAEPLIQPKGDDQIIVDMPGIKDKDEALRVIGKTAVLSLRARKEDFPAGKPAPVASPAPGQPASPDAKETWVYTGVEGTMIKEARIEPQGATWAIAVSMNDEGARLLGDLTTKLVGKPLAIFLDNALISAPRVDGPFSSNFVITGNFDAKEANELAIVLKAGSLPVPLEVIENRTVEASLGAESVQKSIVAGGIGIGLIVLFMLGYYRVPGAIASVALAVYCLLNLAVYKIIPITLTVPGIAGFIISVGMAVDANILIFERTKEELKAGRTVYAAIEIGFKRAFSAILDSNVTTLLSCLVLFMFGTGLVKGFALTLAIGVLLSMFTAITASRNLLHWVLEAKQFKSPTLFGVELKSRIR